MVGSGGLEPPPSILNSGYSFYAAMSYSIELGTILPTRATPITT